jgi:hypothetical protein
MYMFELECILQGFHSSLSEESQQSSINDENALVESSEPNGNLIGSDIKSLPGSNRLGHLRPPCMHITALKIKFIGCSLTAFHGLHVHQLASSFSYEPMIVPYQFLNHSIRLFVQLINNVWAYTSFSMKGTTISFSCLYCNSTAYCQHYNNKLKQSLFPSDLPVDSSDNTTQYNVNEGLCFTEGGNFDVACHSTQRIPFFESSDSETSSPSSSSTSSSSSSSSSSASSSSTTASDPHHSCFQKRLFTLRNRSHWVEAKQIRKPSLQHTGIIDTVCCKCSSTISFFFLFLKFDDWL